MGECEDFLAGVADDKGDAVGEAEEDSGAWGGGDNDIGGEGKLSFYGSLSEWECRVELVEVGNDILVFGKKGGQVLGG